MKDIGLFYLFCAVFFGMFFATCFKIEVRLRGKFPPYPQLIGGIVAGMLWPAFLFRWMFPGRKS